MFTMLSRAACAGIFVSLALTATGCGGDDTTEAGGKEGASASPTSTPLSPTGTPLSATQLKAALLTATDLPPGFKADPPDPATGDRPRVLSGDQACTTMVELSDQLDTGKDPHQEAYAIVALSKGDAGPQVEQTLTSYPAGRAEQAYTAITKAAAGCKTFVLDLGQGMQAKFTQVPATAAGSYGGDASQVNRFSATLQGTPMQVDQVLVRTGETLVSVDVTAIGGALSPALGQQATQKALGKLRQPGA